MPSRSLFRQIGKCLTAVRRSHTKVEATEREVTEIEIPVPWGKVAGKWWGPMNQQPILTLHGWQDNAASFDPLIPLLPKNHSFLTIDLPGHGLSDWHPTGTPYSIISAILLIRRIAQHYGWENIKLMGHSLGAIYSFFHSAYYPKETKFVIAIDTLKPWGVDMDVFCTLITHNISEFLKIERMDSDPPGYTREAIMRKWMEGAWDSLDEASCKTLMTRSVIQKKDGNYYFTKDPMLRTSLLEIGFTQDHVLQLAEKIECPYLFLRADDSAYFEKIENLYEVVEVFKRNIPDFGFHMVAGKHHVHMTNATAVSELIIPFLEKHNS